MEDSHSTQLRMAADAGLPGSYRQPGPSRNEARRPDEAGSGAGRQQAARQKVASALLQARRAGPGRGRGRGGLR